MSNATSISDIERAEHNGTFGVKKVAVYNDDGAGNLSLQPKTATEETLQASLSDYRISDIEDPYYGYVKADGGWYIMQLTATTARYVKGDANYTTAWTNRATPLGYDYFFNIW
jgi:hypothetical protein